MSLPMLPFSHHASKALHHLVSTISFSCKSYLFQHFSLSTSTHRNLLALISTAKSLRHTNQSHASALLNGFLPRSVSLCASLILRYATFLDPPTCYRLFQGTVPYVRSAFLWNTLIRALSIARVDDNFETYNRMVRNGVRPDDHTFPFVLKACADSLNIQKGMEIHGFVFKLGFDLDVFVGNTLLLFYGNCGNLTDVKRVFDEMLERDVVSWNTVLGVFSVNGFYVEARDLFCEMNLTSRLRPNMVSVVTINNALIDVYGKCGHVKTSRKVFDQMMERNEVSWNAIITSLAYLRHNEDALEMFRLMINEEVKPNSVTISSMLPILVELGLFKLGKEIHGFSLRFGIETDVFIANSLIDMYAKSGHSSKASNVFYLMPEKNVVSWNAMVANFAQNRLELLAIELVRQMQIDGEIPNLVTFTNVLPACARMGFLRPGKEVHARIIRIGCHFDLFVSNALTDMYAKCGYLNLAQRVFNTSLKDEVL
ncbi:hypothetical protein GH714_009213 [Hevea brasiliensis]|uniref:Pentatricopeptide repeat-containing protein n=1 Tax=Hevea brasiliensis TaxID=3981 RepID=A0A6A6LJA0_HEVBR|nr:hypothetical protein GH714_009213 [Hevea brasiliensis]